MYNLTQLILFSVFTFGSISCYAAISSEDDQKYYQSTNKDTILILKENSNHFKRQAINRMYLGDLKWPTNLETKIKKDFPFYHVVSNKITETVSSKALQIVSKSIENEKPKIIIISLGENDGLFSKRIDEIKLYLTAMIKLAQKSNAKIILVGNNLPQHYGLHYTNSFTSMYADLAKQFDLAFVPENKITYTYPIFLHSHSFSQMPYLYQNYPSDKFFAKNFPKMEVPKSEQQKASEKIWAELDKMINKDKKNSVKLQGYYRLPEFYHLPEFVLSSSHYGKRS